MNDYLRSFVIGSSGPVFLPFFWGVTKLPEKTYDYVGYSFKAPLYFGLASMLGLYLSKKYGLSLDKRLLLLSQLSPAFVSTWITVRKAYEFKTKKRWYQQYALVYLAHVFTWLVTIKYLEKTL